MAQLITEFRSLVSVEEKAIIGVIIVQNCNFCVTMFQITKLFFCLRERILFEITMLKITGLICLLNYIGKIGKRTEIGFVPEGGKIEITVFEIAGVDC